MNNAASSVSLAFVSPNNLVQGADRPGPHTGGQSVSQRG